MIQLNYKTSYDNNTVRYDYTFEKYKEYLQFLPYLTKPIKGVWTIAIFSITSEEVRELQESSTKYIDIDIFLDKEQAKVVSIVTDLKVNEKTTAQKFMSYLATTNLNFDKGIEWELYRRVGYDINSVEVLKQERGLITKKVLDKYFLKRDIIFSTDVLYLFFYNKRRDWKWKVYYRFEESLGRKFAFYAIRKKLRLLIGEKRTFMQGQSTNKSRFDCVGYNKLAWLHIKFEEANSYELLPIILLEFERRF